MVKNTISLVVTSYNSIDFIESFRRFLENSCDLFKEIIVIDDCSDDGSYDSLLDLKKNFDLNIIRTVCNSGRPSVPRNMGIEIARGNLIMFLDIDDFIPRNYIEMILSSNLKGKIFSGTKLPIDVKQYIEGYPSNYAKIKRIHGGKIAVKNFICFSGSCAEARILKKYKFKNIPLEDYLFWKEIFKSEKNIEAVKFLDVPIGYNSNLSLSPNKFKQVKRISERLNLINFLIYFFYTLELRLYEKELFSCYSNYRKKVS